MTDLREALFVRMAELLGGIVTLEDAGERARLLAGWAEIRSEAEAHKEQILAEKTAPGAGG